MATTDWYEINGNSGLSEQVFPCRCGETHRGEWGWVPYYEHQCLHQWPLYDLFQDDEEQLSPQWTCPGCAKYFSLEGQP